MKINTFKNIVLANLICVFSAFSAQADFNLEHPHVPGELIVKFKDGASPQGIAFAGNMQLQGRKVISSRGIELLQFAGVNGDVDLHAIAKQLSKDPNVEYVEANQIYTLESFSGASSEAVNDPRFSELFGLHNTGQDGGTEDADIDAPEAWQIGTGSHKTKVGVIDTGIDYTHPDLADNIWINPGEDGVDEQGNDKRTNGIDDDGNGYIDDFRGWDFFNADNDPMDGHSHGTHCAGTIGATGNNGIGVVGVSWKVSLIGLKIFSDQGRTSVDKIVPAIEYATTMGFHFTSNSWGGGGFSEAIKGAISQANDAGILFIAAAGNSSSDNDARAHYPSSYELDNIIAVASTDKNDKKSSFSSYGATSVDVAAPGSNILSTVPGAEYKSYSGTSMATPHVAGLAALIKSTYPEISGKEVKARILGGAEKINGLTGKAITGARINAYNSLDNDSQAPGAVRDITVAESTPTQVILNWSATGDDGTEGYASSYEILFSNEQISKSDGQGVQKLKSVKGNSGVDQLSATLELPINTKGFVVIRAFDNVGNVGAISGNIAVATKELNTFYTNLADSMNGMTADEPWGIEVIEGQNYFSDSPGGNYANETEISLRTDQITVPSSSVSLALTSAFHIEKRWDHAYIELSTDGTTWKQVARLDGQEELNSKVYKLDQYLGDATAFQLRFRIKSDRTKTYDGWQIKSIQIFEN